MLGLTFKENVVDIRNSQVVDIIRELASFGVTVQVHDPLADPAEAAREYGIAVQERRSRPPTRSCLRWRTNIIAAAGWPLMARLLKNGRGLVMDVKATLDPHMRPEGIELWRL